MPVGYFELVTPCGYSSRKYGKLMELEEL